MPARIICEEYRCAQMSLIILSPIKIVFTYMYTPLFAWNETLRPIVCIASNQSSLPPFFIATVQYVKDVSMFKRQSIWRAIIIFDCIMIKQCSVWGIEVQCIYRTVCNHWVWAKCTDYVCWKLKVKMYIFSTRYFKGQGTCSGTVILCEFNSCSHVVRLLSTSFQNIVSKHGTIKKQWNHVNHCTYIPCTNVHSIWI